MFRPQHFIVPSVSNAQEYAPPRETLVAVVMPSTSTGVALCVMLVLPSCPSLLLPQHSTVPPVRTAHEWPQPALTWMAVAMPSTSTGVVLSPPSATLVFPSSPASLLPQHAIVPSFRRAHEWL